jgi:hypothetical protein
VLTAWVTLYAHRMGDTEKGEHPLRGGAEASVAIRSGAAKRRVETPLHATFPANQHSRSLCGEFPRETRPIHKLFFGGFWIVGVARLVLFWRT